jgi:hypothetical protein
LNILLPGAEEITVQLFRVNATIGDVIEELRLQHGFNPSRLYEMQIIGSPEILREKTGLRELPGWPDLVLVESICFHVTDSSGRISEMRVPSESRIGEPRQVIRGRFVTDRGLALPSDSLASDISAKYGTSLSTASSFRSHDILLLDGSTLTLEMSSNASVLRLREVLAAQSGQHAAAIALMADDVLLDDGWSLEAITGPIKCVLPPDSIPVKPPNYDELLSDLVRLSAVDVRTVARCFNFHNYDYEQTRNALTAP